MKKILSLLLVFSFFTVIFMGCSKDNTKEDEALIKNFITKVHTVEDYKKIDETKLNNEYPNDQYTKELESLMTDKAFEDLVNSGIQRSYILSLYNMHANSVITKLEFKRDSENTYTYNGKVKITFNDKNETKEEDISGQITVEHSNNKTLVSMINKIDYSNILKYKLNN